MVDPTPVITHRLRLDELSTTLLTARMGSPSGPAESQNTAMYASAAIAPMPANASARRGSVRDASSGTMSRTTPSATNATRRSVSTSAAMISGWIASTAYASFVRTRSSSAATANAIVRSKKITSSWPVTASRL